MRLALLTIAVAIGYAIIGFDPPFVATLTTRFPSDVESFSDNLEVRIHDLGGVVERVETSDGQYPEAAPWISAEGVEGRPNDLRINWMGGACLARIRVAVSAAGDRLGVHVMEERSPGGMLGCMAVGVNRSLLLHLSRAFDPRSVSLHYPFG